MTKMPIPFLHELVSAFLLWNFFVLSTVDMDIVPFSLFVICPSLMSDVGRILQRFFVYLKLFRIFATQTYADILG